MVVFFMVFIYSFVCGVVVDVLVKCILNVNG
jgi:hypothetical protein